MSSRFVPVVRRLAATVLLAWMATSCAPGTDGVVLAVADAADTSRLPDFDGPIEVTLPHIPAVALPDLSEIGQYDGLLEQRLGGLELQPVDGVEFITNECESGETLLEGDQSIFESSELAGESFTFSIDAATGETSYYREANGTRTSVKTQGDGSGTFVEEGFDRRLSIEASVDGSGRYYSEDMTFNGDGVVTKAVEVDANGSGVYYRQDPKGLTTITLGIDGSGSLYAESEGQLLTIDAHDDGTGDLYLEQDDRVVTLRVRSDQSWELSDTSFRDSLNVKVSADGSGNYRQRGSQGTFSLDFDATGASQWLGEVGPMILLPPQPVFDVAARFPALGTLASIQPPCTGATVLRFDSQVLFAVNEATVLPEAALVLAEVAPALIEAGQPFQVNGHTDATGSEAYNLDLSQKRAQAVADELVSLGVDVELTITGLGESQPVAENYNADGSDNLAGQRQNRRVEIVIGG